MEYLNYHHLYHFWTVCKEGGFSKAAARLGIAQSAVSHQVSVLEDFLGEKLMDRGPRGFTLTQAGQVTLAGAEEIFRQGNDLLEYFRSGKMKASFRVGALGGLSKNLQLKILGPVIENASTELTLEVGDSPVLLDRLLNFKLDAVLSDVPFSYSEAEPLVQKQIASESICVVGKNNSKSKNALTWMDKLKDGIYLPSKSSPITAALYEQLKIEANHVFVRGFIDDIAILRLLAIESSSLVAIPRIGVQRELERKELHVVHEFRKIQQSYFLIYRQKGKLHPALKSLSKL